MAEQSLDNVDVEALKAFQKQMLIKKWDEMVNNRLQGQIAECNKAASALEKGVAQAARMLKKIDQDERKWRAKEERRLARLERHTSLLCDLYAAERLGVVAQALRQATCQDSNLFEAPFERRNPLCTAYRATRCSPATVDSIFATAKLLGVGCDPGAPHPSQLKAVITLGALEGLVPREVIAFLRAHFKQICGVEFAAA